MSVSTDKHHDRAWVEIDLDNLVANADAVGQAASSTALLPMVKADGYGLGALPIVAALASVEPWGLTPSVSLLISSYLTDSSADYPQRLLREACLRYS